MKTPKVASLLFLSAVLAGAAPAPQAPPPAQPTGAAMTIYKDPITGRLMPVPAGKEREVLGETAAAAAKRSTSHEGLVEVAAPGGGMMVDLRGRFQHAMTASLTPTGNVTAQCDGAGKE